MGILNVTPDSFSDGGAYDGVLIQSGDREHPNETAVENALFLIRDRQVASGDDFVRAENETARPAGRVQYADLADRTECAAGDAAPVAAGEEHSPGSVGMTRDGVEAIWRATERLYATGMHPGISLVLRRHGTVVPHTGRGVFTGFLDMPTPAWDLLPLKRYRLPLVNEPYVLIETSRGCPYSCDFCVVPLHHGHKFRERSAKVLVDEIAQAKRDHGIRFFYLWGDTVTLNAKTFSQFCDELIARDLNIRWLANARADNLVDLEFDLIWERWSSIVSMDTKLNATLLDRPMEVFALNHFSQDVAEYRLGGSFTVPRRLGESAPGARAMAAPAGPF